MHNILLFYKNVKSLSVYCNQLRQGKTQVRNLERVSFLEAGGQNYE